MREKKNLHVLVLTGRSFPQRTGMIGWMDQQARALVAAGHEVRQIVAFEESAEGWDGPYSLQTLHGLNAGRGPLAGFKRLRRVYSLAIQSVQGGFRPDILLVDSTPGLMFLAARLRKRFGSRFIAVVGGNYFNEFTSRLKQAAVKRLYRAADAVVVDGEDLVNLIRSVGVEEKRIFLLPHGIDVGKFRPDGAPDRFVEFLKGKGMEPPRPPIVFSHGTLKDSTGCDLLPEIASSIPEATFVLAGAGPMEEYIRNRSVANLMLLGFMGGDVLPSALSAVQVCVYPFRHMAGVSLAVVEAMSCGCPTVVTDRGDLTMLVKTGVNGMVVPGEDTSALIDGIRELLNSDEMRATMGTEARREVERNWSLEKRQNDFVQLIERLTGQ